MSLFLAFFFTEPPYQILKAWHDGKLKLVISTEILDEFQRVRMNLHKIPLQATRYPGAAAAWIVVMAKMPQEPDQRLLETRSNGAMEQRRNSPPLGLKPATKTARGPGLFDFAPLLRVSTLHQRVTLVKEIERHG